MPKKPLIVERDVLAARRAGRTTVVVPPDALVTALARDAARDHGIEFVAPPPPQAAPDLPASPWPRTKRIALGADHGGFDYKIALSPFIESLGWTVQDVGTHSTDSVDYPDFAFAVAKAVGLGECDFGVMIDGVGVGSAMAANKLPGIRAAVGYNEFAAWNGRAHNDANVLTLGSRAMGVEVCKRVVQVFLETAFEGGRHGKRVDKITAVERQLLGLS